MLNKWQSLLTEFIEHTRQGQLGLSHLSPIHFGPFVHIQCLNQSPTSPLFGAPSTCMLNHPACRRWRAELTFSCLALGLSAGSQSVPSTSPRCQGVSAVVPCHVGDEQSNGQPRAVQPRWEGHSISCPTCSFPSPAAIGSFTAISPRKPASPHLSPQGSLWPYSSSPKRHSFLFPI